jgi:hypothetical protein
VAADGERLEQSLAPEAMRGRVIAAIDPVALALLPAGALLGGVIAKAYGTMTVMILCGGGTMLISLALPGSRLRQVRDVTAAATVRSEEV